MNKNGTLELDSFLVKLLFSTEYDSIKVHNILHNYFSTYTEKR